MTKKRFRRTKPAVARRQAGQRQRGTAIIIAVLIMGLLAVFVAAALSRVTTEALINGNDRLAADTLGAAQASLERMTRNFSEVFDVRIAPGPTDLANIRADEPDIDGFEFDQRIFRENEGQPPVATTVESGSEFAGLVALRESWILRTTATSPRGGEVRLTRTLNNYTIPIFQFGIFYDDPMEHHAGPAFNFGGRVHTNGDIYLMGSTGIRFRDRVTAHGEVVVNLARNGSPASNWGNNVFVNDGQGAYQQVTQGSVINGPDINSSDPDVPDGTRNSNWTTFSARFRGNLVANAAQLRLPLQIGNRSPIEIIKRGLATDDPILRDSRYYNKPCVRVCLSNRQVDLPGGSGGVRLDGAGGGYLPMARPGGGLQAVRINGYRLSQPGREAWIKIEIVTTSPSTLLPVATDVTTQALALGMTEPITINGVAFGDPDSIFQIQRYAIVGPPVKVEPTNVNNDTNTAIYTRQPGSGGDRNAYSYITLGGVSYNVVTQNNLMLDSNEQTVHPSPIVGTTRGVLQNVANIYAPGSTTPASDTDNVRLYPFPIMMFDTREGLNNDSLSNTDWTSRYTTNNSGTWNDSTRVPYNGVMSLLQIDVANFRRLTNGVLDATVPVGFRSADLPDNDDDGWIIYVSDRRNDLDNDGEYDNENVYVTNPGDTTGFDPGEDTNHSGGLNVSYDNPATPNTTEGESATYAMSGETDILAFRDTRYFRRAVRLVRGQTLPGDTDTGFTVASENGVYLQGNYNASGISSVPSGGNPTPYTNYTGANVPASVVSDSVTMLSNNWNDGKSFRFPFTFGGSAAGGRTSTETTVRVALLMGDTLSSRQGTPNQGGGDPRLAGGVHNFIRFAENWGTRFNYCGSLINLFNSVNNNGPFKCCTHIYSPPTRNWVFDATFLDATRLPPGTPFFQYLYLTGFRQEFNDVPDPS